MFNLREVGIIAPSPTLRLIAHALICILSYLLCRHELLGFPPRSENLLDMVSAILVGRLKIVQLLI